LKDRLQVRASDTGSPANSIHTYRTLKQAAKIIVNALIAIASSLFALRALVQFNNLWIEVFAVPIASYSWDALVRNFSDYAFSSFEVTPEAFRMYSRGQGRRSVGTAYPWAQVAFFDESPTEAQVMLLGNLIDIPRSVTEYGLLVAAIRERAAGSVGTVGETVLLHSEIDLDTTNKILWFIANSSKIHAIKLFREKTGMGLKESKEAVEQMEREMSAGATVIARPVVSASDRTSQPTPSVGLPDSVMAQVCDDIRQGRKINAIKLYREVTGVGLKDAKDAVEQIERDLQIGGAVPYAMPPAAAQAPAVITDDVLEKVQEELRQNRTINAIRIYRDATKTSLMDARIEVDRIQRALSPRAVRSADPLPARTSVPGGLSDDTLDQMRELIRYHREIEAVKLYRKATGAGLRDAKEFVDRMRETM